MKKVILFLLLILFFFFAFFIFAQEKSPMYYKGVDAGMSPDETIKILGKPYKIEKNNSELIHYYLLKGGGVYSFYFYKQKWLYGIAIKFPTSFDYSEFGLEIDGGNGFTTKITDEGNKIWKKNIETKKFGTICIIYRTEPGYQTFIDIKIMKIIDPTIFDK